MTETSQESDAFLPVPSHDYQATLGDRFLEAVKAIVPNAETRHHFLAGYAKLRSLLPLHPSGSPALEKTIRFHDRSVPLIVGNPIFLAAG